MDNSEIDIIYQRSLEDKKEVEELIKNDEEFKLKKRKRLRNLCFGILAEVFIMGYIMLINASNGEEEVLIGLIVIAVSYIFITAAIYYSIYSNVDYDLEVKKKMVEIVRLREYNEAIETMYNDIRSFKHDYINIFTSMIGYIDEDDFEGLKDYFNNNIMGINENLKHTNTEVAKLSKLKIKEVKGLVATKILKAQRTGIDVTIDILDEVDNINIPKLELSRCLGILIDNSIEAAALSEQKKINFGIIKNESSVSIIITNSFNGQLPPIQKLFQRGFSTKGENRGVGLSFVKGVTSNMENVLLDIAQEGKEVVVFLEVMD